MTLNYNEMNSLKIQYWPYQRGIELNTQVSKLFKRLYFKFNSSLYNKTPNILSIDIVNVQIKKEIFKIILLELEILVLDLTELEVSLDDLIRLNKKILIDLTYKSVVTVKSLLRYPKDSFGCESLNSILSYKSLLSEHRLVLQDLLIFLVFGSEKSITEPFSSLGSKVTLKQVEVFLDNIVIQLANIIFFDLINSCNSLFKLFNFLKINNICSETYISTRSIATFRNNLIWSQALFYYVRQPQIIYNNRYQVWIFSKNGISCQYIYTNREISFYHLSKVQIIIIVFLELQDFLVPKVQTAVLLLGKLCIYLFRNTIGYIIKISLKNFLGVTQSNL